MYLLSYDEGENRAEIVMCETVEQVLSEVCPAKDSSSYS